MRKKKKEDHKCDLYSKRILLDKRQISRINVVPSPTLEPVVVIPPLTIWAASPSVISIFRIWIPKQDPHPLSALLPLEKERRWP